MEIQPATEEVETNNELKKEKIELEVQIEEEAEGEIVEQPQEAIEVIEIDENDAINLDMPESQLIDKLFNNQK